MDKKALFRRLIWGGIAGILLAYFVMSFLGHAQKSPVINDVPPKPQGLAIYVTDFGDLLAPADEQILQQRLQALDEQGSAQIAILTLPNTDRELSEFSPIIMNQWGVGHRERDDGILILANAQRIRNNLSGNRIFVGTGAGVEGILPDAVVGRILDEQALPAFQQGDYSGGIRNTVLTLAGILEGDPTVKERYPAEPVPEGPDLLTIFLILLFIYLMFRFGRPGIFLGGFGGGGGGFGGGFGGGRSGGGGAGR